MRSMDIKLNTSISLFLMRVKESIASWNNLLFPYVSCKATAFFSVGNIWLVGIYICTESEEIDSYVCITYLLTNPCTLRRSYS